MKKFLVMDVDGTLTDGKIYMGSHEEIMKCFHVKDGCGIKELLPRYGIIPVIITGRKSNILEKRCEELGILDCYQMVSDKKEQLKNLLEKYSLDYGIKYTFFDVAYIGDDLPDLKCMRIVKESGGVIGCPADAIDEIIKIADYICKRKGGEGAVREFIEYLCFQ